MLPAMLSRARKRRVLMAVSARAAERMCRILEGMDLECPGSLRELAFALRCQSFDLVIVGCDFDGSQAIDAMKMARLNAPRVPLACVRVAPFSSALGEATISALHSAAEELGADCFIDVLQFPDDPEGNARVLEMLERLVCVT
jgi:hypothetical protein